MTSCEGQNSMHNKTYDTIFHQVGLCSCENADHQTKHFIIATNALCGVILLVNLVLISMNWRCWKLRKKPSIKCFMNLQVSHILLAAYVISSNHYHQEFETSFSNAILLQTFLSLTITSMDRYIAIRYPFKYRTLRTKQIVAVLLLSWSLSIFFFCVVINVNATLKHLTVTSTILISVSIMVLMGSNIVIFFIARKHEKVIINTELYGKNIKRKTSVVSSKSANICFALVASFMLLWLPYLIHNILSLKGTYIPDDCKSLTQWVEALGLSNSIIDPIFFVLFRRDVKNAFHNKLCCFRRKKSLATSIYNVPR